MVRAGVPLPEIGQVLRHRDATSTSIYARVDIDQLRTVARPWPQAVAPGERAWPMHVEDYLRLRRALGFKLVRPGHAAAAVRDLAGGHRIAQTITVDAAISLGAAVRRRASRSRCRTGWARCAGSPATCITIDPATEIPPAGLFGTPAAHHRPTSIHPQEIGRLLRGRARAAPAAAGGDPRDAVRAAGRQRHARRGGAAPRPRATSTSVDGRDHGSGTPSSTGTGWCRCTPAPPKRCAAYAAQRDRLCPQPRTDAFFVSSIGRRAAIPARCDAAFATLLHFGRDPHRDRRPSANS